MSPWLLTSALGLYTAFCCSSTAATTTTTPPAPHPPTVNMWDYLPHDWASFCRVDYDLDPEVNATLSCHVTPDQRILWRLADFRQSLSAVVNATGLEVGVRLECEEGGRVSLPYPFRAPGLVKLTVRSCGLLDKWADFATPAHHLPDSLRERVLWSCTWLNDPAHLRGLLFRLDQMDSHYECGQDSTLVLQRSYNVSQQHLPPPQRPLHPATPPLLAVGDSTTPPLHSSRADASTTPDPRKVIEQLLGGRTPGVNGTDGAGGSGGGGGIHGDVGSFRGEGNSSSDAADDVLQTMIDLDQVKSRCRFQRLQVHEESFSSDTNVNHFEFMVKDSTYPALRILNFTGIGLLDIPKELRESRRKFYGSKLGIIDVSYNYVQELGLIPAYPSRGIPTRLVVRHNNITRLNLKMFQDLALVPNYTVDLGGNPIACDCDLKPFLMQLQDPSLWTSPAMEYYRDHVSAMACATPAHLSDRLLGSLETEHLPCPVSVADLRAVMGVMGVVVVILLVMLALAVRYRKEVRILMYTRVNILLPCGRPPLDCLPEKTYDAFVAYAHQDSDWVLGSLMKRLEGAEGTPKGRRPCKLCLHQRDFVVGKPIIDNIVDCIAASRHTIVVLTNSFVRSGWAMEELEHAYRQSIEERRRHLVVVVLEEVEHSHMNPVLRRCCKTFTYLHVSDSFFWDRLLYSVQVAEHKPRSKKRPSLTAPDDRDDTLTTGNINKGFNSDEEQGVVGPTDVTLNTDMKKSLFLETMRTVSVESTGSTVSDTVIPVTPSQVILDRPLFETAS